MKYTEMQHDIDKTYDFTIYGNLAALELRFIKWNASRGWFHLQIQNALSNANLYELVERNEIENKLFRFLIGEQLTRNLDYITLGDVLMFCVAHNITKI